MLTRTVRGHLSTVTVDNAVGTLLAVAPMALIFRVVVSVVHPCGELVNI